MILAVSALKEAQARFKEVGNPSGYHRAAGVGGARNVCAGEVEVGYHLVNNDGTTVAWLVKHRIGLGQRLVNPWHIAEARKHIVIEISAEKACQTNVIVFHFGR